MKKFSTQGFLNPGDSPDSGWWKFSWKMKDNESGYKDNVGHVSTRVIIADCSNQSHLEFDTYGLRIYSETNQTAKRQALAEVRARRKKWLRFQNAVNKFGETLLAAYDEAERNIEEFDVAAHNAKIKERDSKSTVSARARAAVARLNSRG